MPHRGAWHRRQKRQVIYEERIKENTLIALAGPQPANPGCTPKRPEQNRTILRGRMLNNAFQSSLNIHATDTIEVRDYTAQAVLDPAVTISLILAGRVEGSIDGMRFALDGREAPAGYLWCVRNPSLWMREVKKDMRVRKVNISISPDWLVRQLADGPGDAAISTFLNGPVQIRCWQPSKRALVLAEQIIDPPDGLKILRNIHVESRALDIMGEALESLLPGINEGPGMPDVPAGQISAQHIRDYLERNLHRSLTLAGIAKELGLGVTNLQDRFKAVYDLTVMDYVRERRLGVARDAMERDGLTIAQAAHLAGYNSPANFATAFKRVFGISPSNLK